MFWGVAGRVCWGRFVSWFRNRGQGPRQEQGILDFVGLWAGNLVQDFAVACFAVYPGWALGVALGGAGWAAVSGSANVRKDVACRIIAVVWYHS